jgi:DAACS family dicarboxylate/amino acid:cation (Na+ or H+) symporter/aerobic C4-dicarboxylate transport protein
MSTPRRQSIFARLYVQLLIAILLGIVVGIILPKFPNHLAANQAILQSFSTAFVKLLRMLLGPIIFGTVVTGIAKMGEIKSVGRVGLKALIYFEVVSTIALLIGLIVVNVVQPGKGMNVDPSTLNTSALSQYSAAAKNDTATDFLLDIIPTTTVSAFTEGKMLQVILVSVLFGISLSLVPGNKKAFIEWLDIFLHAMFGIVRMVMYLAPLAAFGAMAAMVSRYGVKTLENYGELLACVYLSSLLFIFGVLGSIARFCNISFGKFLRYIWEEILIVFGTCSTEAVLPQMLKKMENIGCDEAVVGLVLPTGYTFNLDGTSIYLSMAALFIAQACNVHLTIGDQLLIMGILLLTSKGSGGVAGAGFVALLATLSSLPHGKIPPAGIVLLLGVESLINQARAVTNLIGNGIATIAVAQWDHAYDAEKGRAVLSGEVPEPAAVLK